MVYMQDGQRVENVFHVKVSDAALTDAQLTSLLDSFQTWYGINMKPNQANTVSLVSIIATDLTGDGLAYERPITANNVGTANGVAYPNSVTIAIKWLTSRRGRSYRGRTFHIGLTEAHVPRPGNRMSAASVTSLQAAYANLLLQLSETSTGSTLVVLSTVHDGAPRAQGVTTPITTCQIDPVVDNQRRRLPGRGN